MPVTIASKAGLPDFRPAPNQGGNIELYEAENQALDPEGHVLAAMRARAPWAGRTLLDLGCGSGYWLARYAGEAAEVIGVEPEEAASIYTASLLAVNVDNAAERGYLAMLAARLNLEDALVKHLHASVEAASVPHAAPAA